MTATSCIELSLADRVLTYVLHNPEDKPTADAKGVAHMRRVITQRHKNTPLRYRYAQQGELLRVWRTA